MAITTMAHVRVDEKLKAQAKETLAAMVLSVSVRAGTHAELFE